MTIAGVASLELSMFQRGMMSVFPTQINVKTSEKLCRLFESPPTRPSHTEKRALPAWSPAIYEEGVRRSNANVKRVTALVYDYDHTTVQPEEMINTLQASGYQSALYTTWSHGAETPRYRVVLFLSRDILPGEYERAWRKGIQTLGVSEGVDEQA